MASRPKRGEGGIIEGGGREAGAGAGVGMALAAAGAVGGEEFGDGLPFGDPTWYRGWRSPYFNDSHRAYRERVRGFVENEVGCLR